MNNYLPTVNKIIVYSFNTIVLFLFFGGALFATEVTNAQSSVKEIYIDVNFENDKLTSVFNKINKETGLEFVYNKTDIKNEQIELNGVYKNRSVYEVLLDISKTAQLRFKQINQNINVQKNFNSDLDQDPVVVVDDFDITGTVLDESGTPLPGVTVLVKGTANGTTTDINGEFKLKVNDGTVIVVSFIGYETKELTLSTETNISISLYPDVQALDEVVVVGYGTQEVANLTSSVGKLKSKAFKDIPVSSIEQGIASQIAGVEVVQNSGRPGQSNQINIRGISTMTAGTSPLVVLDGMPLSVETSLNSLNPNDIASIEVLKDAASASIYGSRGSNGVILVTTKMGDSEKVKFSFNAYVGVQQVANTLDLMNANEHAVWDRDARNNYYLQFNDGSFSVNDDNATREANAAAVGFNSRKAIIPSYVQPYLDGEAGLTDTDWQDELFRNAKIENYQISAQGSNENTSYFVSGNYFFQEGVVLGTDFKRFNFRSNLKTKLSDRLTMGLNLAPSFINENVISEGFNDGPINAAIISLPYFPAYNADGSLAISNQTIAATEGDQSRSENPVAMALMNQDERSTRQLLGSSYLEFEVIKGLKFKTFLGLDLSNFRRETFNPSSVGQRNTPAPDIAEGSTSSFERLNWITENTLVYETKLSGGHNLDVLIGYSFQEESYDYSELSATDFPNDLVTTLNAGIINAGSSISSEWALISYLSRVRYNYQGKYLLTAAIRRDGSSRFGSNSIWGVFPSVSAGYRVSDELFFPETNWISDVKLRGSWGKAGNNQIGDFGSLALLTSSNSVINGSIQNGLAPFTSPNPNLSWEETTTVDIGVDLGFFEDKLTASLDYYIATTDGLLLDVPVPAHSGYSESLQNLGKIENKGFELNLRGRYSLGPVQVISTFNIAANRNKVLELGPGQDEIISGGRTITRVGGQLGESYGYKVLGVFTSQEQIDNTPSLATAQVGEYIYADTDNNQVINSDDRVSLGSIHPDYTFGFSTNFEYKGFDLGIIVQGVQGVHIHNRTVSVLLYNPEGWNNGLKDYYDNYYTPERGENSIYARPNALPSDNGFYRETDLLQEDASFVRVRNITLGYTVPNTILEKVGIESLRLYVSSKNPFTSTDFRGYNPEQRSGSVLDPTEGWGNYPVDRSVVVGVNMNF